MRRTLGVAIATVVTAVALWWTAAAVANEDDTAGNPPEQQVGLSLDGIHYGESLRRPIFGADVRWGPGDVRTGHFFVRHEPHEGLSITLVPGDAKGLFDDGDLAVEARAGAGEWRTVSRDQTLHLPAGELPSDRKVPVSVRVSLAGDVPADTTVRGSDFGVTVALGALVEPPRAGAGERATWWVVPMGLLLLSGGAVLYARRETVTPGLLR